MKIDLSFKDLFCFKKLITPSILTYVYWLSCAGIVLFALISLFSSFAIFSYYGFSAWIVSFFTIIISTLVFFISARISFELIIVLFNINDNLKKIAEKNTVSTEKSINQMEQD